MIVILYVYFSFPPTMETSICQMEKVETRICNSRISTSNNLPSSPDGRLNQLFRRSAGRSRNGRNDLTQGAAPAASLPESFCAASLMTLSEDDHLPSPLSVCLILIYILPEDRNAENWFSPLIFFPNEEIICQPSENSNHVVSCRILVSNTKVKILWFVLLVSA